jgi:hypothetical protein
VVDLGCQQKIRYSGSYLGVGLSYRMGTISIGSQLFKIVAESYPRSPPAFAISSIESLPSLHRCICKSPLTACIQEGLALRMDLACKTVKKPWRISGGNKNVWRIVDPAANDCAQRRADACEFFQRAIFAN